jgi:hypothetical protein
VCGEGNCERGRFGNVPKKRTRKLLPKRANSICEMKYTDDTALPKRIAGMFDVYSSRIG